MAAKKAIDWELMEADWVAGLKSVSQLSEEYGVSRAAILKHWKNEGIERSLEEKIKIAAAAKVTEAMVTGKVTPNRTVTDKEIIKAAADLQATVILQEREEIKSLSDHADRLEKSLESSAEDIKTQSAVTKQVVEIREKIINLRRRNYGVNDNANGDADKSSADDLFKLLSGSVIGVTK